MSTARLLYHTIRWECRNITLEGPRVIPCPARGFGSGLDPNDVARIETEAGNHHREAEHTVEVIHEIRKRYEKAKAETSETVEAEIVT